MFNFLARIGRRPWARLVTIAMPPMCASVYIGIQHFGHSIVQNLFSAQSSSGKRIELSSELQRFCMEVFRDLKDEYNVPIMDCKHLRIIPSQIKWFMAASYDPIVYGMSESRSGVIIGLPSYFNYTTAEDIPEELFEIKKYYLLRNPFGSFRKEFLGIEEEDKKQEENLSLSEDGSKWVEVTRIDKDSQAGKDFINSLLLSEKAKKYVIAKQMFKGDSYRPFMYCISLLFNGLVSVYFARGAIAFLKLSKVHVARRLPFYMLSAVLLYGNQKFIGDAIDTSYEAQAEKRTLALGQLYVEGAKEYKAKEELRDKVLSSYLD